ncbi:MAG: hypothetical protein M3P83_03425, partial [Actinomycetota bacterium]|nr:hypothetical protein [Actinomycetota bacterium]
MSAQYAGGANVPLSQSENVQHVGAFPGTLGISGCFVKTAPFFYVSGLDSLTIYNARDPLPPRQVGKLDNLVFENEAMNCGERTVDGKTKRFVLIGVDTHQASSGDTDHVNVLADELGVVDVTKPAEPRILSRTEATTSTHTIACVTPRNCRFAYSAGSSRNET